jgi:hypothetical protein
LVAPALAFVAVVLVFADFFVPDFVVRVVADFADGPLAVDTREARGSSSPVSVPAIFLAPLVTVLPAPVTALVMREIVFVRFAMELSPRMWWHKRNLIGASSFRRGASGIAKGVTRTCRKTSATTLQ